MTPLSMLAMMRCRMVNLNGTLPNFEVVAGLAMYEGLFAEVVVEEGR